MTRLSTLLLFFAVRVSAQGCGAGVTPFSISVVNESYKPVPAAFVNLDGYRGGTDKDGKITFCSSRQNLSVLSVSAPGYTWAALPFVLSPQTTVHLVRTPTEVPADSLAVLVLDPSGAIISDAEVTLEKDGNDSATVHTDRDGYARFSDAHSTPHRVAISAPGFLPLTFLSEGQVASATLSIGGNHNCTWCVTFQLLPATESVNLQNLVALPYSNLRPPVVHVHYRLGHTS